MKIEILTKNYFPNSLGFLYTGITQLLGFKKFGDEYKVMALAAFGKPKKINEIGKILSFIPPYKIKINKKFFNFNQETLLETKFDLIKKSLKKFLSINNDNKNIISKKKLNIASSLQTYFQSVILKISRNLYLENYSNNLCLAGGCFYNSVLNGYLKKNLKFKKISIYPNAGDAGGSVGAALYVASNFDKNFKIKKRHNLFLGPKYSSRNISEALNKFKKINNQFNIYFIPNYNQIYKIVSDLMIKNKIVCWFQGRAEFGPRALGNRSILTSARAKNIREILNKKIKLREKFRPFAASIILEEANKYFEIDSDNYQFMNFVFKSRPITKKKYPAIVHFDGTTRIHTVNKKDNKIFYNLLKFHYKRFRDPLVLNTSLNIDEPMCLTPEDVLKSFANSKSKIDCIVLNQYLLINKHSG